MDPNSPPILNSGLSLSQLKLEKKPNPKLNKRFHFWYGPVGILLLMAALVILRAVPNTPVLQPVKFGYVATEANLPFIIAIQEGFFTLSNLQIELVSYPTALEAQVGLDKGEVDFAAVSDYTFISGVMNTGSPAKAIGQIAQIENRLELLGHKQAKINGFIDLRGKTVAVAKESSIPFWLNRSLLISGVDPEKVNYKYGSSAEMIELYRTGKVAALVVRAAYSYRAEKYNLHDFKQSIQDGRPVNWLLIANGERLLDSNYVSIASNLLQSLSLANDFIVKHQEQAQNTAVDQLLSTGLGLDLAYVKETWSDYIFDVRFTSSLIDTLDEQAEWVLQSSDSLTKPNLINLIELSILEQHLGIEIRLQNN